MAIILMALSLVSMASIQQDVFAQTQGMTITATTDQVGNIITVTGKTISDYTDITFSVWSPSGNNLVAAWQTSPDNDGNFGTTFTIGPNWTEDGYYTIIAKQGESSLYELEVEVKVIGGVTLRSTSVTESNLSSDSILVIKPNVTKDAGLVLDEIVIENGSTMFEVTGTTDRVSEAVTFTVIAPNGNVVSVAQVAAALDGEIAVEISVGGSMWKQDGFYTVTAYQNDNPKYSDSKQVDILDGVVVPEFGTIAAMILAVSIISIIAISAKSRLSIMPRY
jgi:predicted secreted protein with PEFG-CTERM motif